MKGRVNINARLTFATYLTVTVCHLPSLTPPGIEADTVVVAIPVEKENLTAPSTISKAMKSC